MKKGSACSEVTSSSDCPADDHPEGGPVSSGFPPPDTNGVHTTSSVNGQENDYEQCAQNGFMTTDSSTNMLAHEAYSGSVPQLDRELDENDAEDQDSTISELSGLSDLSNISEQDWNPNSGPSVWIQRQISSGIDPRMILGELLPRGTFIPHNVNDQLLWRFIVNLLNEPKRSKLAHINTLDDAVNLLRTCKRIIVLTGAGVSVSCGIPDFRSRNGIYARLSKDYPDLPDPQAMFDINYFRRDPRPFFKFAKEIYPGLFEPSSSHKFIKLLEKQNKLLRNYTQNIDTLEHAAGIQNVITCHGSFATATCTICRYKVDSSVIKEDIFNQRIPYCPVCPADSDIRGIMKPDIVFFGEGLSDEFHEAMACDKEICDLLIVIGSSLKVRPVAMIPSSIPSNVPQILINREPLKHLTFDVELLGDCDVIIGELCRRLETEWEIDANIPRPPLKEIVIDPFSKHNLPVHSDQVLESSSSSEVNNNLDSQGDTNGGPSSLAPSEESNSCDCRGLSAIKLDDSEDGSNQEQPVVESNTKDDSLPKPRDIYNMKDIWPTSCKESVSKRLPDRSYFHFPPCRYIFEGAEVYKDGDDDGCSTPTDYSSDCGSPKRPPLEENVDFNSEATLLENECPRQSHCEQSENICDKKGTSGQKENPNT